MTFACSICRQKTPYSDLADLPCCLVCASCTNGCIRDQILHRVDCTDVKEAPRPGPVQGVQPGDTVLYRHGDGTLIEAIVEIVDVSVQPPQYGIQLPGAQNLRFTEQTRLFATTPNPGSQQTATGHNHHFNATQPRARCPGCAAPLGLAQLRAAAPQAVAAWEAHRTETWLRANNIIRCPNHSCGALIQRDGNTAAAAAAAAGPSAGPSRTDAHRDAHRYRCGACGSNFCDACGASPYHSGYTCEQAVAHDCLTCGQKVDEYRLQQLLPDAAANVATSASYGAADPHGGPVPRHGSGRAGLSTSGSDGGWASVEKRRAAAEAAAKALVRRATVRELRRALGRLGVDSGWCLERPEYEKALLYWGTRTCDAAACAARLQDMCTRALPCGHWCAGLRGEGGAGSGAGSGAGAGGDGEAVGHPRCLECGLGDGVGSAAAGGAGGGALLTECCFCWEALTSAPVIELACGARHPCHLHCALERLAAGYPGPHISFAHLYCPLCRGAEAAGGSGVQACLAPAHLSHPRLAVALAPHLALREGVVAAARGRLRLEPDLRADPALRPGGAYDGRPADFAVERMLFYKCGKCSKPYYGGQRACGAAAAAEPAPAAAPVDVDGGGRRRQGQPGGGEAQAAGADQADLLCGDCSARAAGTNCPKHGTAYIEWKCRYCCEIAVWFCFGTTHMCEPCHRNVAMNLMRPPQDAAGGPGATCTARCRLQHIPHPPPGQEACLGCGMCRAGL